METRFGSYQLLKKIANGGMAELYLARAVPTKAAHPFLVIKKILPHLNDDQNFLNMFHDETRIASQLVHPNIVRVLEVGQAEGTHFMAMEYIRGRDLTKIMTRCQAQGMRVDVANALQIVTQLCGGLHYAHERRDVAGQPLGIIHRDVSPQNILVSMEGLVKLIDFGIAAAAFRESETKTGTLKGKFAYMSPEQCAGRRIDPRSDIFSVGIVLWELVTGVRLFWSPSAAEIIQKVCACRVPPPCELNPLISPNLNQVVLKALQRQPENRYRTVGELQRALERFSAEAGLVSSQANLSQYMHRLFGGGREDARGGEEPAPNHSSDAGSARSLLTEVDPCRQAAFFEGRLELRPLPMLFQDMLAEKRTGTIYLESPAARAWIHFEDGLPAAVDAPSSKLYLGQILRELGLLDDESYNRSMMAMAQTRRLQGELLLEAGKITAEQLHRALSLQQTRKFLRLFFIKAGHYRFVAQETPAAVWFQSPVDPLPLVCAGILNAYAGEELAAWLETLAGKACKVTAQYLQYGKTLGLAEDEAKDVELLHAFRLPQEFVNHAVAGPARATALLMALFYTGMLDVEAEYLAEPLSDPGEEPQASRQAGELAQSSGGADAGTGDPAIDQEDPDRVARINAKYEGVVGADLWQVLEVARGTDPEDCRRAYLKLAKQYHPDRFADLKDEELRRRVNAIAAMLNEAGDVLTDPRKVLEYSMKSVSNAQDEKQRRQEEARFHFQKAQVYIKTRQLALALECLRWAVALDPDNGDYQAHRLWAAHLQGQEGCGEERLARLVKEMAAVYRSYRESFHAAKYLWQLCKRTQDTEGYRQALSRAFRLNSKDLETAREVRLLVSRERKRGLGKRLGGWLRKKDLCRQPD